METSFTDLGKNLLLNTAFANIPTYVGLILDNGNVVHNKSDTMLTKAWTEFVAYTESARPLWVPGVASNGSIKNPVGTRFSFNASGSIWGFFIVTLPTKGATTGTLIDVVKFDKPLSVVPNEFLDNIYEVVI